MVEGYPVMSPYGPYPLKITLDNITWAGLIKPIRIDLSSIDL